MSRLESYIFKEVVPADIRLRNELLIKLGQLRSLKQPNNVNINIKRVLRNRLRQTDESVTYWYYYKGIKVFLGDSNTRKKHFLSSMYSDKLVTEIKKMRLEQKKKEVKTTVKYTGIDTVVYDKIGGVMRHEHTFIKLDKSFRRTKTKKSKAPNTKEEYVGIELEYASKLTIDEIVEIIVDMGLYNQVRPMLDSSIQVTKEYPNKIELCILSKLSELDKTLDKLKTLITHENFLVNNSCGLHVHVDARDESRVAKIYGNLTSMQSLLFSLAAESRRCNFYCTPVLSTNFEDADGKGLGSHYAAISKHSYYKHKTIEVRIHESTLDLTLVKKWINLIQRISKYNGPDLALGTLNSELKQLREQIAPEPELMEYVERSLVV